MMAGYQDENVSISSHQIRMGGQVFPPSMVRSVHIVNTSSSSVFFGYLFAIPSTLMALGAIVAAPGNQKAAALLFGAIAALFGWMAWWHTKWPNLELRVMLHSGGQELDHMIWPTCDGWSR